MKNIYTRLMRNINIKYDNNSNNIAYDEYYFNGRPIPKTSKLKI